MQRRTYHIIPIVDNTVFNRISQRQNTSLCLSLISDIAVFLAHSNHNALMTWSANNRWEDSSRCIVTSKTSLHHSRSIVNDTCCLFFVCHFSVLINLRKFLIRMLEEKKDELLKFVVFLLKVFVVLILKSLIKKLRVLRIGNNNYNAKPIILSIASSFVWNKRAAGRIWDLWRNHWFGERRLFKGQRSQENYGKPADRVMMK